LKQGKKSSSGSLGFTGTVIDAIPGVHGIRIVLVAHRNMRVRLIFYDPPTQRRTTIRCRRHQNGDKIRESELADSITCTCVSQTNQLISNDTSDNFVEIEYFMKNYALNIVCNTDIYMDHGMVFAGCVLCTGTVIAILSTVVVAAFI
jgi:hypothetical protein